MYNCVRSTRFAGVQRLLYAICSAFLHLMNGMKCNRFKNEKSSSKQMESMHFFNRGTLYAGTNK